MGDEELDRLDLLIAEKEGEIMYREEQGGDENEDEVALLEEEIGELRAAFMKRVKEIENG